MTPLEHYPELAAAIGLQDIYFKREDLHPYESHKGRSIPVMIDTYYAQGERHFAISSSGNAALAAALYVNELNATKNTDIDLDIFVGQSITPKKSARLRDLAAKSANDSTNEADNKSIRVLIKERPLQALTQAVQEGKRSLRQSTDDLALVGYESLAQELSQVKNIGAVFMGTSSGTTAQALAQYFLKNKLPIQVHIIQTSSCHPISQEIESYDGPDERSVATAISDITAYRKDKLVPLIKKTGGFGWIAANENISSAIELVSQNCDLEISVNSALSVAGAMLASYRDCDIKGSVVCMICGD